MKRLLPFLIISASLLLSFTAGLGDSAIMDEVAHIPAGYSYMSQNDMRLNPEHPPLVKDLAGFFMLPGRFSFPSHLKSWKEDVNGQWNFGFEFMYKIAGSNPDLMLLLARLPMLLIFAVLGLYLYRWARELIGPKWALLPLFLYSFSPTLLAHSHYVTTDVAAASGFFIATYYFVHWLQNQTKKNLIYSGIVLGIALLTKFSTFLLLPYFILIYILWTFKNCISIRHLKSSFIELVSIFIVAYLVVGAVYIPHVLSYPPKRQARDANFILESFENDSFKKLPGRMAETENVVLRAYGQYLLGLFMVIQRASGGNTTYFLGEVAAIGWKQYFPVVYAIKEHLVLHILTVVTAAGWILKSKVKNQKSKLQFKIQNNFPLIASLIFIIIYWAASIRSNLNIGVRHLIPTFPFLYLLIGAQIPKLFEVFKKKKAAFFILSSSFLILLVWYGYSALSTWPSYISYFNEFIGGSKNGYKYVVDSNLDWGQDLKRLTDFVSQNLHFGDSAQRGTAAKYPQKIKVDYFGGGDPKYYLGDAFEPLSSKDGPQKGWIAVSATFYQTSKEKPETSYAWLDKYTPVAKIGNSIFVYNID